MLNIRSIVAFGVVVATVMFASISLERLTFAATPPAVATSTEYDGVLRPHQFRELYSVPDALAFTALPERPVVGLTASLPEVEVASTPLEEEIPEQLPLEPATLHAEDVSDISSDNATHLVSRDTASSSLRAVRMVPFYSQFSDITSPKWQKAGCGIASLAMIIDYYRDDVPSVDTLLEEGIAANAFLTNAGWIHSGLIGLARTRGLEGESVTLSNLTKNDTFQKLRDVVERGPVLVSVHYTFEPTNPIPHLVVITDIEGDIVHYNDPAEAAGNGTLSKEKFLSAWKKRYIEIRPTS